MSDFSLKVSDLSNIPESLQPFYKQDAETGEYFFSAVPQTEFESKLQAAKANANKIKQKSQELARQFGVDNLDTPEGGRIFKEKVTKAQTLLSLLEENGVDVDSFPELLEKVTAQQQGQGQGQGQNAGLDAKYQLEIKQRNKTIEELTAKLNDIQKERDSFAQKETFRNAQDSLMTIAKNKGLSDAAINMLQYAIKAGDIGFEDNVLVAKSDVNLFGTDISIGTDLPTIVETLAMQNASGFLLPSKGTGTTSVSGSDASQRQTDMQAFSSDGWDIGKQFKIWQKNPSMYDSLAAQAGAVFTGMVTPEGLKVYDKPIAKK